MDWSSLVTRERQSRQFQRETHITNKVIFFLRDIEKVNKTCFFQWLSAHVNIEGNEKEDKLAKEAS